MQLQLAPTIRHQAMAMISLLQRYKWHTFSIITGEIGGYRSFAQVGHFTSLAEETVQFCPPTKIFQNCGIFLNTSILF